MVLVGIWVFAPPAAATSHRGSFVDQAIFFEQATASQALVEVSAGTNMQMYMFNLRSLADKQAALADPNIWTVQTPGSVNDMLVNPVPHGPAVAGFNPFTIREVREGLHWLIDRDFIVEQIYGGFGVPFISPFHPRQPEYARQAVFFQNLDRQYSYQPQMARDQIFTALSQVSGMDFVNGQWMYQGNPLTVTIVIRTEDTRLDIGNYVADQVETLGITVVRDYKPAAGAFAIVYSGPPDAGAWHLYTEGWAFTALDAWPDGDLKFFFVDDGFSASMFAYAPPATLTDVADTLEASRYSNAAERLDLIRRGSNLAMSEGVRIFLTAENAVFIANKAVTGYVYDLSGGPWTLWTTRSARYACSVSRTCTGMPGGILRIGQPVHFTSPWNPVGGFAWLYDSTQRRAFSDFGVWPHPHTGLNVPLRSAFTVQTAGPTGTLNVPTDARTWDVAGSQFVNVGSGVTAVSKITYDHTFGKWHHNVDMSMDDVWYVLSNYFRRQGGNVVNPLTGANFPAGDVGAIDSRADSPAVQLFLSIFKGARQVDADTMEIYLDFWHLDDSVIAAQGSIFPDIPWEVHELMARTVLDDETRYHPTSASAAGKPSLDLVKGASMPFMDADLATLMGANFVPAGFSTMITASEATARWSALNTWRTARGHFYASNGPFFIETVDVGNKQTVMSRFVDYPFFADKYDGILLPRVPNVAIGTIPEVVPGLAAAIPATTTLNNQPYGQMASLEYLITNPATGQLLLNGAPAATTTGNWEIRLTAEQTSALLPGTYDVQLIGVGSEAALPTTATKTFVVIPQLVFFERLIRDVEANLGSDISDAQDSADQANQNAQNALNEVRALSGLLTAAIALAVIAILAALVGIAMAMRRRPGTPSTSAPAESMEEMEKE